MEIINTRKQLCVCCMEEHDVETVIVPETNTFKGIKVEYRAKYFYCDNTGEFFSDESMSTDNDIAMKDAYRRATGLLTTEEISAIRRRYGITQSDLCLLLGWGAKTITRYESHQIQDIAHDTILRKLNEDPEWFLSLLESVKDLLGNATYEKYFEKASQLYASDKDRYLKRAIMARYAGLKNISVFNGNTELSFEKVVDVIRYFSNSENVTKLYKVKLMKLLWYADALSFKRYGHSITGLVYQAMPMGALPVAHEFIIDFSQINYEEIEFGEGTGIHFLPTVNKEYSSLTDEDKTVLNDVITRFGDVSKEEIVNSMHSEIAYTETSPHDLIQFKYAESLSLL